jgi:hypothetical protein
MQYIIYCDESADKGAFYSNFYGGALLRASDKPAVEAALVAAKKGIQGEAKWTKVNDREESAYIAFADKFLELIKQGMVKMRVMFTQNINSTDHVQDYEADAKYFKLYYQFVKHAFGLMYCNPDRKQTIRVAIYLDTCPDKADALDNFKNYLASLTVLPDFFNARVIVDKDDIAEVNSKEHIILQALDVITGAIQFKLNEHDKVLLPNKRRRGKRTRAKAKVYRHINQRLRDIRPGFNIGITTGQPDGPLSRWLHPYRHWCFKPHQSVVDRSRGKRFRKKSR